MSWHNNDNDVLDCIPMMRNSIVDYLSIESYCCDYRLLRNKTDVVVAIGHVREFPYLKLQTASIFDSLVLMLVRSNLSNRYY